MNYTFQRNPQGLIEATGRMAVSNPGEEAEFLEAVRTLPDSCFRPLVLVVGGFLDQVLGNSYTVASQFPPDLKSCCDIWFREYYETEAMRGLVRCYTKKNLPIALIGHSWGADAAVNAVAAKVTDPIRLLISLDPVSRKGPPRSRLLNVGHWLNIHVDYAQAPWLDISNIVARIGGPWEDAPTADVNITCPPELSHAWALGMFLHYGEATFRQRMGLPSEK